MDHYRDAKEEVPSKIPKPRERPVQVTAFVDVSRAPNKVDRRSYTGYVAHTNLRTIPCAKPRVIETKTDSRRPDLVCTSDSRTFYWHFFFDLGYIFFKQNYLEKIGIISALRDLKLLLINKKS